VYVSSCHVYAPSKARCREDDPVRPQGRYGLSKQLCEQAALAASHLDVRIARPFNHLGSGMPDGLAVPSIVQRVRDRDGKPLIMNGLDSVRDFLDVADIARGYIALLDLHQPVERIFNVCSGVPRSIGELARALLATAGDRREVVFEARPLSQDDTMQLVGTPGRLQAATGWQPEIAWLDSIAALIAA
jgi:GDP-4-dehydro-6-deoxy-D-mannose reductase